MKTSFDFSAKSINRATITDGKLLQRFVAEPLSSNDETILANLNELYTPVVDTYNTVKANYLTNWPNSAISGFKTIKLDSFEELGGANISSVLALSSKEIQFAGNSNTNTLHIEATPLLAKSYYIRSRLVRWFAF